MLEINVENQQMFNAENLQQSICVDIKKQYWKSHIFFKKFYIVSNALRKGYQSIDY